MESGTCSKGWVGGRMLVNSWKKLIKTSTTSALMESWNWVSWFYDSRHKTCDSQTHTWTRTLKDGGFGLTRRLTRSSREAHQGPHFHHLLVKGDSMSLFLLTPAGLEIIPSCHFFFCKQEGCCENGPRCEEYPNFANLPAHLVHHVGVYI